MLPVFHSFGLTGGTILPLATGVKLFLYPSPLHYKLIPETAAKARPTILFGTDTFLGGYARSAKDTDFASLRLVVAGAEPVRSDTRRVWRERFGAEIVEGYGLTEAAPVVAVNTAAHGRDGSVGRLLPGMRMRLEPVEGIAEGGRLWVSGPNVMMGYMTADRPGVIQPLERPWHDTGDIVAVDREGFVFIRGRAKRFAKIAGEMVSLGAVEMLVAGALAGGPPRRRDAARQAPRRTDRSGDHGDRSRYRSAEAPWPQARRQRPDGPARHHQGRRRFPLLGTGQDRLSRRRAQSRWSGSGSTPCAFRSFRRGGSAGAAAVFLAPTARRE